MPDETPSQTPLLVFADDWGRHPSSCQHLIRHLGGRYSTYWVNTIGMRKPRLDLATFKRGLEKVFQWTWTSDSAEPATPLPGKVCVLSPKMWPWFTTSFDRRLNRRLLARPLTALIRSLPAPPVAITALPITADLVGVLPVRRWVYYCVDDFSVWPGLDGEALRRMEADLVSRVDVVVAVSEVLQAKAARMGRVAHLLTHGVDCDFWQRPETTSVPGLERLERPLVVFWGVVDRRMDVGFIRYLAETLPRGTIVLAGPENDPDKALRGIPRVACLGPVPFPLLPSLAAEAAVLVMPYADLPVTRAIQPLKLKEYLATGKPVVVRDLPATRGWADCLDVAATPETFAAAVCRRMHEGLPLEQRVTREERLREENWARKAAQFEEWALCETISAARSARGSIVRGNGHSPPRRVMHLRTVSGRGGGPEKTLLNSPRFLRPQYEMRLAYIRPEGDTEYDMPERARCLGADLIDIPERHGFDLRTVRRLAREIRDFRPDILHAHDYKTNVLAILLGHWFRLPAITTMHGYGFAGGRLTAYYQIDRWALSRMAHVVAVSDQLYQKLIDLGIPASRRSLIYNAIDTEQYDPRCSIGEARQRVGLDPTRLLIGAVGRLTAVKGFDLLIRAADQLLAGGLDLEVLIVGEGEERQALQTLIERLGRADRIRLLGHRTDVRDIYAAMDVCALSSLSEGLPNVVLEAMALRVPVVATAVGSVPQLVTDGSNGLLVPPGSAAALAEALARLLGDAALRNRLREGGRQTVETRFSFAARMDRIRQVYDTLLGRPA